MTKRNVVTAALALVIVGIPAPSVSAACNPPKFASTYNPATGAYAYWTTSLTDASSGAITGRIWSGGIDYTGTCNDGAQTFFYFGAVPGSFGMSISLGTACVPPGLCPSGNLNVRAWVTYARQQETSARQVPETPAGGVNFDFSDEAVTLAPSPRPRVGSSGHVSGTLTNIGTLPEPIPGDAASLSTVTGCNILSATAPTDPGRSASAYPTLLATTSATGGTCASANVPIDCTSGQHWLVFQLVTNAGPDPFVGPATQINCNPALAEPKNRVTPKKNAVSIRN